jgi:hypothetical protein
MPQLHQAEPQSSAVAVDLPTKALQALVRELVGWGTEFRGDSSAAGKRQAFDDAMSLARGIQEGPAAKGQVKAAATKSLARGLRARVGLHLVDRADFELIDLLRSLDAEMPADVHMCKSCNWIFEANRARDLCDRCGQRPRPEVVSSDSYTAIPLPRYRDGKPDGWRIFRTGLCHECGSPILPDDMKKSNTKTCSSACRVARHRRRQGGDESEWSPKAQEELDYREATAALWPSSLRPAAR